MTWALFLLFQLLDTASPRLIESAFDVLLSLTALRMITKRS